MDSLWVVPNVSHMFYLCLTNTLNQVRSCLAYPDSPDTPSHHQCAVHTDILLGMHKEEILRKPYGIAPGAMVRI